jgi:hypothetical protein
MAQSAHPAIPYSVVREANAAAVPWTVWCGLVGIASIVIGLYWDVSWHMSIGRDTFWTPAHLLIQFGGILIGAMSAYLIFSITFGQDAAAKAAGVGVWGFRGPLGAFLACWGGVTMVTSAPFDNWWHNAFGLDVEIVSPPHMVLALGIMAVEIGALLMTASAMNRAEGEARARLRWIFLLMGGLMLSLHALLLTDYTTASEMHSTTFYIATAIAIPIYLVAIARASGYKWGATAVAFVYTAFALVQLWGLPLFPATPKLGPVFTNVTHMVPLNFPMLLIVPAIAIDLILNHWGGAKLVGEKRWVLAARVGIVYVALMLAVHWKFAEFMLTPAARNWIFGQGYFPYAFPPSDYHFQWEFSDALHTGREFCRWIGCATLVAIFTSRVGLAAGDGMEKLRR